MKLIKLVANMMDKIKKQDAKSRPFCSAVVPAAGNSTRMAGCNKQFSTLQGIPVLAHTLRNLEACGAVDEIVVATRPEDIPLVAQLAADYGITKLTQVVSGGDTRGKSVAHGADACAAQADLIAVYDGARPLGTPEMIARTIALGAKTNAAVAVVPMKDTIKYMSDEGYIDHTPDRAHLRAAQMPQVFDAALLKAAYAKAEQDGLEYTDDCAVVEALGKRVYVCDGETTNIKITTPDDLILAEAILEARNA